jgi:hypothetical protein
MHHDGMGDIMRDVRVCKLSIGFALVIFGKA